MATRIVRRWEKNRTCAVTGCAQRHYGHDLCKFHYQRWRNHGDPLRDPPAMAQLFWNHVDKSAGADGCWLWLASKNNKGYGHMGAHGLAHRFSWGLANGAAGSLCVLHRCDTPLCVNPAHLFLGTRADNNADRAKKGRTWHPTACPKGHLYDESNSYFYTTRKNGWRHRICKTCKSADAKARYWAKRAAST